MVKLKYTKIWLTLVFFSCYGQLMGQGFKGINPLESTCEDVKRILKVEQCTLPISTYRLKDYRVSISYSKANSTKDDTVCYKVPAGRVIGITVSYNKGVPIEEFEYDLKYKETLSNDIDTIIYENTEKGVGVFTHLGRITTAIFLPTPEQHKKYAFECNSNSKRPINNK